MVGPNDPAHRHPQTRASGRDGSASVHNRPVQFSRELRDRVISGRITVSFRLWQRPQVKVGGRYRVGHVQIHIDALNAMPFVAVTADDVWRSGEDDREKLRRRAAHAGPIDDDTVLYRVEFHVVERATT